MANLTEVSQWENVIRQLENGEAATGGADGLANIQAKQLANRTQWLKDNYLPLAGGAMKGVIYGSDELGKLDLRANANAYHGSRLVLFDENNAGNAILNARNTERACQINIQPNGEVLLQHYEGETSTNVTSTHDLAGAAIVAKSLGANGYIKYASGLIIQWGFIPASSETTGIVTFQLAFNIAGIAYCTGDSTNGATTTCRVIASNNTQFKFERGASNIGLRWAAIGY